MSWQSEYAPIYKQLAENYIDAVETPGNMFRNTQDSINLILELDTANYEIARELSLYLKKTLRASHTDAYWRGYFENSVPTNKAVRRINDYVIEAKDFDLDIFVNDLVDWDDSCIPPTWAEMCEFANINTSNWRLCPVSS